MQSMPMFAIGVKVVGALYLSYLGILMLKSWYRNNQQSESIESVKELDYKALINKGFFNNMLNPKALLFFSLFLPHTS